MEKISISFDLSSSDYACDLGFEVFYNSTQILNIDHVTSDTPVEFTLDVEDGDHELRLIMKNKTVDHTTVDEDGEIVKDACLGISNFSIDNIELGHTFFEQCNYHHDFNGTQEPIDDDFFGTMGCNGSVILKFRSPVYIWMLETII